MAKKNPPDPRANPATNPDFETHVGNLQDTWKRGGHTAEVYGERWYRKNFEDARLIAVGVDPGIHVENPDPAARANGIYAPKQTGTNNAKIAQKMADTEQRMQTQADAHSPEAGVAFARTGRVSYATTGEMPKGGMPDRSMHNPMTAIGERANRASYGISALSSATPLGMDALENNHAMYEATKLSPSEQADTHAANKLKAGTPERQAASQKARVPYAGKSLAHATTPSVGKALNIWNGVEQHPETSLGVMKQGDFGNDTASEAHPDDPLNFKGATGTSDKQMWDAMAGVHSSWNPKKSPNSPEVQAKMDTLPDLKTEEGYAYGRAAIQEAGRRSGVARPKVFQAGVWGTHKGEKDAAGAGRKGAATSWVIPK